jgi:FkbM family methyltransferase
MKRVAIVVQRCHESVVGGSESLAWNYATLLRDTCDVDVLTTTALEISEWANVLPAGREQRDGVNIVRFAVTVGRSAYWGELYRRLREGFNPFAVGRHRNGEPGLRPRWTLALQEEFIKHQGPYSEPLNKYLATHWREYQSIIFVTYLYPTTYFGLYRLPPRVALFAPTLHDEEPAYLTAFKHAAHRARELIWLTEAESRVGRKLWGDLPGRVIGMSVDTHLREAAPAPVPYLLYCGRVDPNKGCAELFEFYFKYKRATRSRLRLVITGTPDMPIPPHPDIDFRGFVSTEEKFQLMAGASVFVIPSPNESFSIVTLEAMAQRTPVLASAASEVMVDHIQRSGAGSTYCDYPSFAAALDMLLGSASQRREMGNRGREYVVANYTITAIQNRLNDLIIAHPAPLASPVASIVRNGPGANSSHMMTLKLGNQLNQISLDAHELDNGSAHRLFVRPMTFDEQIVDDVIGGNEYRLPDRFGPDDVVIDIGAHIGAFSYAALVRGAGRVYAFEAHPINHAIASHNVARFAGRVQCRNLAVWRSDQPEQLLFNDALTSFQPNTGGISVLWNDEGLPVASVSLDDLLAEASRNFARRVRLLKLDCEGAEYPILYTSRHLEIVDELSGEYHDIDPAEVPERALVADQREHFNGAGLKRFLESQGFSVDLVDHGNNGLFHAQRPIRKTAGDIQSN